MATRRQLAQTPLWAPHFETYQDATKVIDDDAYEVYAERAGLKITSYDERLHTLAFDSEGELAAFVRMVTPALQQLPNNALKDAYFNELFAGYKKALPHKEGITWYIDYTLKTLPAVKP